MEVADTQPAVDWKDPADFKNQPGMEARERDQKTEQIRSLLKNGTSALAKPVRNVMIGTPVKGGLPPHFLYAALACTGGIETDKHMWRVQFMMLEGGSLTLARTVIAHQFRKSKGDKLCFIDTDMAWSPEHLGRLLGHDEMIVGGVYLARENDERYIVNGPQKEGVKGDLVPCKEMGTGMLCIDRQVFEEIPKHFPESNFKSGDPNYPGDTMHDFFPTYAIDGELLSEDFFFCRRAQKAGFTVYADSRCIVPHIGKKTFYPKQKEQDGAKA